MFYHVRGLLIECDVALIQLSLGLLGEIDGGGQEISVRHVRCGFESGSVPW